MRALVKWLLTAAAIGIAALPAALMHGFGVQRAGVLPDLLGPGSGALFFLVLIYVVWLPGTVYGLIWVFDRLGYHYAHTEGVERPTRRQRRRRAAGMRYLEARERTRRDAELEDGRRGSVRRRESAAAADRARRGRDDDARRRRGRAAEARARAAARDRERGVR